MTKILHVIAGLLVFCSLINAQKPITGTAFNHALFTSEKKVITNELISLTKKKFFEHPEFGMLPYNAPCNDCIELLQKRDETHRYFIKNGSDGREYYQQSSYGPLSFFDKDYTLRTIDSRLKPTGEKNVFAAMQQPSPVIIDLNNHFTSLTNGEKTLVFNKSLKVYCLSTNNEIKYIGTPSYEHYQAGDEGVLITDFLPGIDLSIHVGEGKLETNFIVKHKLSSETDGWLVIADEMQVPANLMFDYSYSEKYENGLYKGLLSIIDRNGKQCFIISQPFAFDQVDEASKTIELSYKTGFDKNYKLYVPLSWLNAVERNYPVTIDPTITIVSTLPQFLISGSGYSGICFSGGCTYNLDVSVPPACEIVDIKCSFNYMALGNCKLNNGAWNIKYNDCQNPKFNFGWYTCTIGMPGICQLENLSCFNDFKACIAVPQCADYNMPMILTFTRCNQPGSGCGFSCINAHSNWNMTVFGKTAQVQIKAFGQLHGDTVCSGSNILLTAVDSFGIGPYTVTWNPGGVVNNSIVVTPTSDTVFTATISDSCGSTYTDSIALKVVVCTGIESYTANRFSVSPNPVNNQLTLHSSSIFTNQYVAISVLNVLGKVVQEENFKWSGDVSINIKNIPVGIYFVQVSDGRQSFVSKFVKE